MILEPTATVNKINHSHFLVTLFSWPPKKSACSSFKLSIPTINLIWWLLPHPHKANFAAVLQHLTSLASLTSQMISSIGIIYCPKDNTPEFIFLSSISLSDHKVQYPLSLFKWITNRYSNFMFPKQNFYLSKTYYFPVYPTVNNIPFAWLLLPKTYKLSLNPLITLHLTTNP